MPISTSTVMAPVLARQFCKLQAPPFHAVPCTGIPPELMARPIATPLKAGAWDKALAGHPNSEWVATLVTGMQQRFRIGIQETPACRASLGNTPSAQEHRVVADQYIQTQLEKGYMAGPFSHSECAKIITSSIAVIPKKTVGKWRVIVDMSRTRGASVNDNLRRGLTHIAFSSVEDAAHLMHYLSPSTLLTKMDVSEAYRLVPIHPEDHIFLGIQWQDASYVDCQLPSAPAIFSALARHRNGSCASMECEQSFITWMIFFL